MLQYQTIPVTPFQQNCSLIWDDQTQQAAVIDPGGDLDLILLEVQQRGLKLEQIWLTHAHIDHAGGTAVLARTLNLPIVGPHPGDQFWIDRLSDQGRMFQFPDAEVFTPTRWLADGDTGYGNALSVQKTIRAYARAGAAAVLLEDKIWPRPLGRQGAKLVVDRDAARLRCRAAVEACREEGILLLARTDARTSRGFDEALGRLNDFVAEGADIFFLDSPATEAEMRAAVAASNGKPHIAVTVPGGKHFMPDDATLERIGIKLVTYPQDILAASIQAIRAALAGIKGGPKPPMALGPDMASAIRSEAYLAADSRWPDPA